MDNGLSFLEECTEIVGSHARELDEGEVRSALTANKFPEMLTYLWQFTGSFYVWPEVLLQRDDLPKSVRDDLHDNLQDELGHKGTLPHTQLFANTAKSLGVDLRAEDSPGPFMHRVLERARTLDAPGAVGQFFANEATPKWGGFIAVLREMPSVDLEFFDVHASEDSHFQKLLEGFSDEQLPSFRAGAIEYAEHRASFMDELRKRVL